MRVMRKKFLLLAFMLFAAACEAPSPTPTPAPTWDARTLLVTSSRTYALLVPPNTFLTSPTDQARLLVSDDTGATWSDFAGGLPARGVCVRNVNLDYAARDALYA